MNFSGADITRSQVFSESSSIMNDKKWAYKTVDLSDFVSKNSLHGEIIFLYRSIARLSSTEMYVNNLGLVIGYQKSGKLYSYFKVYSIVVVLNYFKLFHFFMLLCIVVFIWYALSIRFSDKKIKWVKSIRDKKKLVFSSYVVRCTWFLQGFFRSNSIFTEKNQRRVKEI